MKKFRFLEWEVYQNAQDLFALIVELVKKLPKEYRFDLGSQTIRSALSIILNIAEGSGKTSDKELNRFLEIAMASAHETLACADTMKRMGFMSDKEFDTIAAELTSITNQLGGFKKTINTSWS